MNELGSHFVWLSQSFIELKQCDRLPEDLGQVPAIDLVNDEEEGRRCIVVFRRLIRGRCIVDDRGTDDRVVILQ